MVLFLLDGESLELRHCPINTINRAAYEHIHRSRWLRFTQAMIELIEVLRTREYFNLD